MKKYKQSEMPYSTNTLALIILFFTLISGSVKAQMAKVVDNLGGRYEITADAGGSNTNPYTITIPKPAGATTVAQIYAYYAQIGSSSSTLDLGANAVTIDGTSANLTNLSSANAAPSVLYYKGRYREISNMTAVMNKLNSAAAGSTINFSINETSTASIDGVGIIVLWNVSTNPIGTFSIHLGMQNIPISADSPFTNYISTHPVDKTISGFKPILGVGINFSIGDLFGTQLSNLWVGGSAPHNNPINLVTSKAGGYNDGSGANGMLITLGGYGDDPNSNDEDELFNVSNFIQNGQQQIHYSIRSVNTHEDEILNAIYFSGVGFVPANAPTIQNLIIGCGTTTIGLSGAVTEALPSGAELRWFATENRSTPQLTPAQVAAAAPGTYYAFYYYGATTTYSVGIPVIVTSVDPATCCNAGPIGPVMN